MTQSIIEKFSWLTPEFTVKPLDGKTVKIKGVAIPRETISRNNKQYVDRELALAARTWIESPVTENHKNYGEKRNQLGKVNWMEYENGAMEYVAEVWNPEMAAELRLYAQNPSKSKIRGVSIEADYLHIQCPKCGEKFLSETDWRNHMQKVELVKDLPTQPHGIRGRALSIVTAPESPGVNGTTLEVMEICHDGLSRLLDTVIEQNRTRIDMQVNSKEVGGPPYLVAAPRKLAEEAIPVKPKVEDEKEKEEDKKDDEEEEKPMMETKIKPLVLETAPRMSLGEPFGGYDNFEACVKANSDKENPEAYCGNIKKKTEETAYFQKTVTEKLNEIVEFANSLRFPVDDVSWRQKLDALETELKAGDNCINDAQLAHYSENKSALETLQAQISEIKSYDDSELKEQIAAIKPYDDTEIKEQLAAIKPYDDSALKEMIEAIKPYDDAPIKESIAAIQPYDDAALRESLEKATAVVEGLTEKLTTFETQLSEVKAENQTLKEQLNTQADEYKQTKETFEGLLDQADNNIKTVTKTLEERSKELKETQEQLAKTEKTLQETTVLAENTSEKIKPEFKGTAKKVVKETSVPSTFNPYDPNRKP